MGARGLKRRPHRAMKLAVGWAGGHPAIRSSRAWSGLAARAGRGWPVVAEVVVAVLAAGASAAMVRGFAARAHFDARAFIAPALGPVWAAAMVSIALVAWAVQRWVGDRTVTRMVVAVLAGGAAGVAMIPLILGLAGTSQPLNTIVGGDMLFRVEDVTRFGATWHLQDYTLRGLHAFYPPAWFWVAGRTAALLGVVPWRIVAPFTVATIGAALLTAFVAWRAVLTPAGALCAAIGSSLVLPTAGGGHPWWFTGWYSPYSCFVAVVGVAWLAAATHTVRRGWSPGRLAALVLIGAALALTYYLLFTIVLVVLLALAAGSTGDRRPALLRAGVVCAGVAGLTAVFWVPLVGGLLHGQATAGHYVGRAVLTVSLGVDGPAALAVLAVVGVATLAWTIARPASQAVAALLLGLVLYQLLSAVTLLTIHDQLLPYRAVTMLWAALGAAVPVALDRPRTVQAGARLPAVSPLPGVAAVVGAAAILALGGAQGADLAAGQLTRHAHTPPDLAGANAMSRFITRVTGKQPDQLTVVVGLADRQPRFGGPPARGPRSPAFVMLASEPFYGFLPLRARYANPDADVPQRLAVLEAAAACPRPDCTARVLADSRFGPIDALVLRRVRDGYLLYGQEDSFPRPRTIPVLFGRSLFPPTLWADRDFGGDRLFVRKSRA